MSVLKRFSGCLLALFLSSSLCFAESKVIVEHNDPIEVDNSLTLPSVIDLTLEKFPDMAWLKSLEDEAAVIAQRGANWLAGSAQATGRFQEATSGTLHYIDAGIDLPLWNLGQRDAQQALGDQADSNAKMQTIATKLRVAGLVRNALWDIDLQQIRYEQALAEIKVYEQLQEKIARRVELGDLPRIDLLMAETELLQKRSAMILAEAELMHARKRYTNITQLTKIPKDYQEKLVDLHEIEQNHPALLAINSQISRKQAELEAQQAIGSGQTNVAMGVNGDMGDQRSNHTASFNIGVIVPFGGADHLAPHVATINVELNKLISEREQLFRDLKQAHHEAEHKLEVNRAELDNANALKKTSENLLYMSNSAFSVGEINFMDLLKIESKVQQAILNAKEREVILQRDIALYNQAVGVMP
jgi:outer membrane protein TolC